MPISQEVSEMGMGVCEYGRNAILDPHLSQCHSLSCCPIPPFPPSSHLSPLNLRHRRRPPWCVLRRRFREKEAERGRLEVDLAKRVRSGPFEREVAFLRGWGGVGGKRWGRHGEAVVELVLRGAVPLPPMLHGALVRPNLRFNAQLFSKLTPEAIFQALPILYVPAGEEGVRLPLCANDEYAIIATDDGTGKEVGHGHTEGSTAIAKTAVPYAHSLQGRSQFATDSR